jgi:hypothetical protein
MVPASSARQVHIRLPVEPSGTAGPGFSVNP